MPGSMLRRRLSRISGIGRSGIIPTRWVGEQHVTEDLGFIPSFADWALAIQPAPWMGRTRKIEIDLDLYQPIQEISDA
jgi:hypothetical protein